MRIERFTFIKISQPEQPNINEALQWLGSSLGLFSLRDKDSSCFRIFIELLKATKLGQELSSDELAHRASLSRGTVVFHLNKMIGAGIVVSGEDGYALRSASVEEIIRLVEEDTVKLFSQLKNVGKSIDKKLGM